MKQVKNTGLEITGPKEAELKVLLDDYCDNSATALSHLTTAGAQGVKVVYANGDGDTRADVTNKKVYLFGNDFQSDKEAAESCLFEIQNVLNGEVDKKLTLLMFGKASSDTEANSTWKLGKILGDMGAYTPSAWGLEHKTKAANSPNLAVLKAVFAAGQHNPAKKGKFLLVTPYSYAYSHGFEKSGTQKYARCSTRQMRLYLKKIATIKHGQKTLNLSSGDSSAMWSDLARMGLSDVQFFVSLVLAIELIEAQQGWTVTWSDVPQGQSWYAFARAIVLRIVGVDNTSKVTDIKSALVAATG